MRSLLWLVLGCFWLGGVKASETVVTPGDGTLAAAVAAAASGDTLILLDGVYQDSTVSSITIDKSLTIRATSRVADPVVSDALVINGSDIEVIIQGLEFTASVTILVAKDTYILENRFLSGIIGTSTTGSKGRFFIIGNHLDIGNIDFNNGGTSDPTTTYIAGNTLLDGYINDTATVSSWIVGNDVTYDNNGGSLISSVSSGSHLVIANRIFKQCTISSHCGPSAIDASGSGSSSLIGSNLVLIDATGFSSSSARIIQTSSTGPNKIINNIVYRTGDTAQDNAPAIDGAALISGNIIYGYKGNPFDTTPPAGTTITNNLCFNTTQPCPANNLNADPLFVDLVNFQLSAGSPAIDAGPPDFAFADLDRTRNNMGIYGGPWSLDQYDSQRDPNRIAPYVYPLFNASADLNGGAVSIRALGVARMR